MRAEVGGRLCLILLAPVALTRAEAERSSPSANPAPTPVPHTLLPGCKHMKNRARAEEGD